VNKAEKDERVIRIWFKVLTVCLCLLVILPIVGIVGKIVERNEPTLSSASHTPLNGLSYIEVRVCTKNGSCELLGAFSPLSELSLPTQEDKP